MITSRVLRQKYLDFFVSKGHKIIPSASLIPENDPTVLFTTAGMHPLVPYLLGEKHPEGKRLTNIQKCIRLQDIDEVGDNRHDTFFEMLGNWSLGDYFKEDAIKWSWEFLTSPKYLGLDPKKLAVSVFEGEKENNIPRDDDAARIWRECGVPEHKIAYLPRTNNWWGPAGQTGPCGPDTEMFYWKGETEFPPENSNPKTDENNWLEIWNDVFMQYNKTTDGKYDPLVQKNVDTGMGLERTLVALNGLVDVFQVDTFRPLIQKIQDISGHEYTENIDITKSMRVVADHIRTATMIMGDDRKIAPGKVDQGYIVRRLIRRAVRYGRNLGIHTNFCSQIAQEVIKIFEEIYPELNHNREFVLTEIAKEESKFRNTLEKGLVVLVKMENPNGKEIFDLYQSYGFPPEMVFEELGARGQGLLRDGKAELLKADFEQEMKKHQDLSRAGAEQKFKGGLADHGEMSVKYHTACHLMLSALRAVLGDHVVQRGSNITAERVRFDFSHPEKLTDEQKKRVEDLVNYAIQKDYRIDCAEMTVPEAKNLGAMGVFEDRYGTKVKVYSVGDPKEFPSAHENSLTFSKEICGGPHVEHTGMLGKFKIKKEESVSAGVRRIKAVLE